MERSAIQSTTSRTPDAGTRHALLQEWCSRFALNSGRVFDAASAALLVRMWEESFAEIPDDRFLEGAFRATLAGCKFFPSLAEVRAHFPAARAEVYGSRADDLPALPPGDRRGHRCRELVPLAQIVRAFRGAARALPPVERKERAQPFSGFRFPVDPNHEERVRRQAAEILARASA